MAYFPLKVTYDDKRMFIYTWDPNDRVADTLVCVWELLYRKQVKRCSIDTRIYLHFLFSLCKTLGPPHFAKYWQKGAPLEPSAKAGSTASTSKGMWVILLDQSLSNLWFRGYLFIFRGRAVQNTWYETRLFWKITKIPLQCIGLRINWKQKSSQLQSPTGTLEKVVF